MDKICPIVVLLLVLGVKNVFALEITQPTEGQLFDAGSTVRVVVKPQNGESWVAVGIGFDSLPYDNTISAYVREFPLAKDTSLGEYEFKVEALSETKQIVDLNRKIIVVLPTGVTLKSMNVNPNPAFLYKLPVGSDSNKVEIFETKELSVSGVYSDGVQRLIKSVGSGTSYESSDLKIVTVDPNGKITAQAVGTAKVTVLNGSCKVVVKVIVKSQTQ